jgi:hypothetical protein
MDLTALSEIELRDDAGVPHRLGALWAEQPVVLVFLRHFG